MARDYDVRWTHFVEATIRGTLARLELAPGERLLDVGCGTGAFLERLSGIRPGAFLEGLEPVPDMLAAARRRLPPSVRLHEGWADRLPFEAGRFDVVTSCNVLHYLPEPRAALRETTRVLRAGGRVVITDWCDDYLACRICGAYLLLLGKAHFRAYRQRELEGLLGEAGLRDVAVERYKIDWLWGLMTATARKPA